VGKRHETNTKQFAVTVKLFFEYFHRIKQLLGPSNSKKRAKSVYRYISTLDDITRHRSGARHWAPPVNLAFFLAKGGVGVAGCGGARIERVLHTPQRYQINSADHVVAGVAASAFTIFAACNVPREHPVALDWLHDIPFRSMSAPRHSLCVWSPTLSDGGLPLAMPSADAATVGIILTRDSASMSNNILLIAMHMRD